jgi:hypothetical protein
MYIKGSLGISFVGLDSLSNNDWRWPLHEPRFIFGKFTTTTGMADETFCVSGGVSAQAREQSLQSCVVLPPAAKLRLDGQLASLGNFRAQNTEKLSREASHPFKHHQAA